MKALSKENEKKYYKYLKNTQKLDLSETNNLSLISSGNFSVGSVTAWSTSQGYSLINSKKEISSITMQFSGWIQGNCGWTVTITGIFSTGRIILFQRDFGYGVEPSGTFHKRLSSIKQRYPDLLGIEIYTYCYRRSASYCYGSIYIQFSYETLVQEECTEEEALFNKIRPHCFLIKNSENNKFLALKSWEKGQYYGN